MFKRIKEGIYDTCYIWTKEMRSVISDEGVLIFFILVPLIYPLLYSWAYNNEVVRDVPVAVVDFSNSQTSRQFIRQCDASPDVRVAYRCASLDEARQLVGHQVVRGILYFPADFEEKLGRMQQSKVSVYCDMSMMLAYKAIYATSMAVSQDMNAGIQVKLSGNYTDREDAILTKPRENNRYKDLVPVSRHYNGIFRIVFGKSLCYFLIYAVMAAYITLIVPRIFSFTSIPQASDLFALMLPYLLSCIFFGMFLSCVVRYRENVILLVVFTSLPFLFLAGISWPESSLPPVWRSLAYLLPSTFGVRGFVRISSMGATLDDVTHEYMCLWIQALVYFFATCAVYKFQLTQARRHAVETIVKIKRKAEKHKMKVEG